MMMAMAFDYTGMIGMYMMPYGCILHQYVYVHFLRKILRPKVQQICSQMLDGVIILHDNTYPHIATSVTTVFQEYGWEVLNHPPYSPDLSPQIKTHSQNLRNPLGDSFQQLKCAVGMPNRFVKIDLNRFLRWVQEIDKIRKNQFFVDFCQNSERFAKKRSK